MRRRLALLALGVALLLLGLARPVPIDPQAFEPGPDPRGQAPFEPNGRLARHSRIELQGARGPEDLHVEPDGSVLTGVEDGRILRLRAGRQSELVQTGGRPLGIEPDGEGGLYIADARRGLLQLQRGGGLRVLADAFEGRPLSFVDDVDRGPDGTVCFTEADARFGYDQVKLALLDGGARGSVYCLDPATGALDRLATGLHFANGLAISADGGFALVTETLRHRVLKIGLRGEERGRVEVLLDHLPGFPDNIHGAGAGVYWLALAGPRDPLRDAAARFPLLRRLAARLPGPGLTRPRRHGQILALNQLGRILHYMDDPDGGFAPITAVVESGGQLYLGSLSEPAVGRVTAPIRR